MLKHLLFAMTSIELKIQYFGNKSSKKDEIFLWDLEKGLDDPNINLLYACIHDIKYNHILGTDDTHEPVEELIYNPNIHYSKYSYNFEIVKIFFFHPKKICDKKRSNMNPIIILTANNKLIDEKNICLLKLLLEISRCRKLNWKALEIFECILHFFRLRSELSECKNRKLIIDRDIEYYRRYLEFLSNARSKNYNSIFDITKDVILSYLDFIKAPFYVIKDFKFLESKNIFNCSQEIIDLVKRVILGPAFQEIMSSREHDLMRYLN